jgi:SAM-dependent methyltransferase
LIYDGIADFGLLYDSVPLYAARADVPFYVDEAKQARGEVLEVGSGTGRILLPIARARCAIAGLEPSAAMLARCRSKLAAEPAGVRDRVTLHQGDIRAVDLRKQFPLAIAPFRVFQHLTTPAEQLRFLDGVRRHLIPAGRFIFDVFNPSFARLTTIDGTEEEDTPEQILPDGRTFRRTARVPRVRWVDQVSEIELIYYVAPRRGAQPERHVQAFDMRWYLAAELQHLVARAGFSVRALYGDFQRNPLVDGCPEIVVVAERA